MHNACEVCLPFCTLQRCVSMLIYVPIMLLPENTVEDERAVFPRLELETRQVFTQVIDDTRSHERLRNALCVWYGMTARAHKDDRDEMLLLAH